MRTQISRWGNSLAVRLPRHLAEKAGLAEGSSVELDVVDGELRLSQARPVYSLNELLAGITPDNLPGEILDDCPKGQELL